MKLKKVWVVLFVLLIKNYMHYWNSPYTGMESSSVEERKILLTRLTDHIQQVLFPSELVKVMKNILLLHAMQKLAVCYSGV